MSRTNCTNRLLPGSLLSLPVAALSFGALSTLAANPAFARGSSFSLLSASEGFVAPSFMAPVGFENPAGVILQDGFKLAAIGTQGLRGVDGSSDYRSGGAGFFAANGSIGGGVAAMTDLSEGAERDFRLSWGVGAMVPGVNLAIGVSGRDGGSGDLTSNLNAGVVFNPGAPMSIGLMVFNFDDGVELLGGGLAFSSGDSTVFVIDAAVDLPDDAYAVKPGVRFQIQQVHLSGSYGLDLEGATPIGEGLSAGVGLELSRSLLLQGYFEHLGRYSASLIYSF